MKRGIGSRALAPFRTPNNQQLKKRLPASRQGCPRNPNLYPGISELNSKMPKKKLKIKSMRRISGRYRGRIGSLRGVEERGARLPKKKKLALKRHKNKRRAQAIRTSRRGELCIRKAANQRFSFRGTTARILREILSNCREFRACHHF